MIHGTRKCCQRFVPSSAAEIDRLDNLATHLFDQTKTQDKDPNNDPDEEQERLLASIIRDCAATQSLPLCKKIHATIARDHRSHLFISNLLIEAYCRCGSLDDATTVFGQMLAHKNAVSWTLLIAANARKGHYSRAFHLFQSMQLEGVRPDRVTYLTILSACSDPSALPVCRSIHAQLTGMGYGSEPGFIKSYSMCGDLAAARDAFDRIAPKSVSCWNAMMIAYAERDLHEEILELYRRMDARPNETTVINVLGACSALKNSTVGKLVHNDSSRIGLDADTFVANSILTMYTKCDLVEESVCVLEAMPVRDVVSWNIILAANARNGDFKVVLELFRKMEHQGIKPSSVTFVTLVQSLARLGDDVEAARSIHSRILGSGVEIHDALLNALLNLYGKTGVEDARSFFSTSMPAKNLVSWNTMISACLGWGESEEALELHRRMDLEGVKGDEITFVAILGACAATQNIVQGRSIHARILASPSRISSDVAVGNALAGMYAACGLLHLASDLLDDQAKVEEESSVVTWSAMISSQETMAESCVIYRRMLLEGIRPNHVSFLSLIAACEKELNRIEDGRSSIQEHFDRIQGHIREAGLELVPVVTTALMSFHTKLGRGLDRARDLFQRLEERSVWPWVAMMTAANSSGDPRLALHFFHAMLHDGTVPDEMAFAVALTACREMKCPHRGGAVHSWFLESGILSARVDTLAINLYAKCGAAKSARTAFDRSLDRRNPVAWSSMIAAYAECGEIQRALCLHRDMGLEGIEQDAVTFVSLLFSCSHGGLARRAMEIFASMQGDHGVDPIPEHYGCVVDLLGRCGHLRDAEALVNSMPMEPSVEQWTSLLNASTLHLDPCHTS
ncbi:pentatricopeptide repeat-containing protein At3g09040, mitochondrial [Selaginella moellendorffii]|uniref:pentatricopeptide repeat-containing protein At3g09040, mitochondrial n=1 Tax=Selaginella moellendorffii TaxID=88036 RepID=UPI000D1CDBA2|nr:pentatricopeptide repeat-containing protein At3g09040, mitochondrial [Selaginella moellendorffii]|eukprot:XP_024541866.1 pentatricopeptide repeat-containing protein At3g09040, mitochondrial [Selaginella moellendorffii]